MIEKTMKIWGRTFDIEIVYDYYRGEEVLDSQKSALQAFLDNSDKLFNIAKEKAEQYCLANNREDIKEDKITNIFKYVKPKALYVKRSDTEDHNVAIMCAYKFNPDDGMAIVFKNEKFFDIGSENIIL